MLHFNARGACKIVGSFVAQSVRPFNVLLEYASFPNLSRASAATIFLLVLGAGSLSVAEIKIQRISSISKNVGEVTKLYLHAGLVSTLEFKQPVLGVKVGNLDSIKAEISPSNPKEITLRLKHQSAEPTNLIVRVDRKVYVFDLIPSRDTHQDYLKIEGSFGMPARAAFQVPKERSKIHPESNKQPRLLEFIKLGVGE